MPHRNITADEAALIEMEKNLRPGVIAYDRPATEAEEIYLDQVDAYPRLAFHAEGASGKIALYVVRRDPRVSEEDFFEKTKDLLIIGRSRSRFVNGREPLSLFVRTWSSKPDGSSGMRLSINSASIGVIFSDAPRHLLLLPLFTDIPSTEFEERSPGRCMHGLHVAQVIHVDQISLQGAVSMRHFQLEDLDKLVM